VTKFPAPRSKTSLSLYHREGGTGRCVYEQQLLKEIARRSFVCKATAMAGGQEGSPPPPLLRGLGRLLGAESAGSYVVQGLSLDQLVSNVFSAAFTRAGEVWAHSLSPLATSDTFSLGPGGRLSLLLTAPSYHRLGLIGHPSSNTLRKPIHKYVVHLNALHPSFRPSKRCYRRAIARLSTLAFTARVGWAPRDADVRCESLAKYFRDLGYKVSPDHSPLPTSSRVSGVRLPDLSLVQDVGSNHQQVVKENEEKLKDILGSLGTLAMEMKPEQGEEQVDITKINSAIPTNLIMRAFRQMREAMWSDSPPHKFLSLCLHSHPEVPFEQGSTKCVHAQGCYDSVLGGDSDPGTDVISMHSEDSVSRNGGKAAKVRDCKNGLQCGCGSEEKDQHNVVAATMCIVITKSCVVVYKHGSGGVRHRYHPKTSNK